MFHSSDSNSLLKQTEVYVSSTKMLFDLSIQPCMDFFIKVNVQYKIFVIFDPNWRWLDPKIAGFFVSAGPESEFMNVQFRRGFWAQVHDVSVYIS
jgi:hypothetical protein